MYWKAIYCFSHYWKLYYISRHRWCVWKAFWLLKCHQLRPIPHILLNAYYYVVRNNSWLDKNVANALKYKRDYCTFLFKKNLLLSARHSFSFQTHNIASNHEHQEPIMANNLLQLSPKPSQQKYPFRENLIQYRQHLFKLLASQKKLHELAEVKKNQGRYKFDNVVLVKTPCFFSPHPPTPPPPAAYRVRVGGGLLAATPLLYYSTPWDPTLTYCAVFSEHLPCRAV